MRDDVDLGARRPGVRAFWIAFGVCAVIPMALPLLLMLTGQASETAFMVLILGSAVALLADLIFLLVGIVPLFRGDRRADGIGLIVGALAGAVVGFGVCMVPLGI